MIQTAVKVCFIYGLSSRQSWVQTSTFTSEYFESHLCNTLYDFEIKAFDLLFTVKKLSGMCEILNPGRVNYGRSPLIPRGGQCPTGCIHAGMKMMITNSEIFEYSPKISESKPSKCNKTLYGTDPKDQLSCSPCRLQKCYVYASDTYNTPHKTAVKNVSWIHHPRYKFKIVVGKTCIAPFYTPTTAPHIFTI